MLIGVAAGENPIAYADLFDGLGAAVGHQQRRTGGEATAEELVVRRTQAIVRHAADQAADGDAAHRCEDRIERAVEERVDGPGVVALGQMISGFN